MAQNLMVCQFCEISNIIRWKCLNCDLILCDECKIKIHAKIKTSSDHTIIQYKQLGNTETADLIRKLDLKNIQCSSHSKEKCSLYCQKCSIPVCSLCVLESDHQGHNFEKLETLYDVQLQKLKERKNTVERDIPCMGEKAETISKLLSDGNISYNEAKQKILQRESEMNKLVTEEAKKLLKQLDELWMPQKEKLLNDEQKIEQRQQTLKQRKVDVDQALQSHEAMSILNIIHPTDENIAVIPTPQGVTFSIIEHNIKLYVYMKMSLMSKPNMVNIIACYETDEYEVLALKTCTNGRNFLYNTRTSTLKYFKFHDQKFATENEARVNIKDATVNENNKIYFVGFDSPKIYTLSEKNKTNTIMDFKDKKPTCIHATKENNLIVGYCLPRFYSGGNQSDEESGIMLLDMKGNLLNTFRYNKKQHQIFKYMYPHKITTNINGDICVVDKEYYGLFCGKIIVIGSLGQSKWEYGGHKTINYSRSFLPSDIVTTRSGMVVVTDINTDTIQVLSIDGNFVTFFGQEMGICRPRCLNIDNEGLLQIGTDGKMYGKSKIHIVKISE